MSSTWSVVAALLLACADVEPPELTSGEDLTGNWLGCADEACDTHTLAGLRLESDGSVRSIHGLVCAERKPCPHAIAIPSPLGAVLLYRCLANLPPELLNARWHWEEDYVVFRAFHADWQLHTHFGQLQVPLRPRHKGPPFFGPSVYPDADWMERTHAELPECPPH